MNPAKEVGGDLYDYFVRDNSFTLFITFFAGVLDLDTGRLSYCNTCNQSKGLVFD